MMHLPIISRIKLAWWIRYRLNAAVCLQQQTYIYIYVNEMPSLKQCIFPPGTDSLSKLQMFHLGTSLVGTYSVQMALLHSWMGRMPLQQMGMRVPGKNYVQSVQMLSTGNLDTKMCNREAFGTGGIALLLVMELSASQLNWFHSEAMTFLFIANVSTLFFRGNISSRFRYISKRDWDVVLNVI